MVVEAAAAVEVVKTAVAPVAAVVGVVAAPGLVGGAVAPATGVVDARTVALVAGAVASTGMAVEIAAVLALRVPALVRAVVASVVAVNHAEVAKGSMHAAGAMLVPLVVAEGVAEAAMPAFRQDVAVAVEILWAQMVRMQTLNSNGTQG